MMAPDDLEVPGKALREQTLQLLENQGRTRLHKALRTNAAANGLAALSLIHFDQRLQSIEEDVKQMRDRIAPPYPQEQSPFRYAPDAPAPAPPMRRLDIGGAPPVKAPVSFAAIACATDLVRQLEPTIDELALKGSFDERYSEPVFAASLASIWLLCALPADMGAVEYSRHVEDVQRLRIALALIVDDAASIPIPEPLAFGDAITQEHLDALGTACMTLLARYAAARTGAQVAPEMSEADDAEAELRALDTLEGADDTEPTPDEPARRMAPARAAAPRPAAKKVAVKKTAAKKAAHGSSGS
jgi:hypothetical protein